MPLLRQPPAPTRPQAAASRRPQAPSTRFAADGPVAAPGQSGRSDGAAVATEARSDRWALTRPYATISLVVLSCAAYVLVHAEPVAYLKMAILGPINGDWWRLFSDAFAYGPGPSRRS